MDHHLQAFMLAFWASMGTFVGAVIVLIFIRLFGATDTTFAMGIMNAFSAGVMLFITAFHLIPESIESIGEMETMSYFFVGILLFGIIERLLHDHSDTKEAKGKEHSAKGKERESKDLIRASQITFIAMALHNLPEGLSVYLSSLSNPKMVILINKGATAGSCYHAP
jgi:ZIP family zinc transporter